MESIKIKNFGPIVDVEIKDIKPFTIFIGDSGSGKSTIMKVLALFQWIYKMTCVRSYLKYAGIKKSPFKLKFANLIKKNGMDSYLKSDTEIYYSNGSCTLNFKGGKLLGTQSFVPREELSLEKISFISDKRSLISDMIESNVVQKKGSFYLNETYEDYIKATEYVTELDIDCLDVKFHLKKSAYGYKHFIKSMREEQYSIKLMDSSSGMQNTIPLNVIVEYYSKHYDLIDSMNKAIFSFVLKNDNLKNFKTDTNIGSFPNKRISMFVEEPELSLFPSSQIKLMDFMINRCFVAKNDNYNIHLILATHSPFIINYLNVLIKRNSCESQAYLSENDLEVYRVYDGKLQALMLQDKVSNKFYVNTSDLSESMNSIYEEYVSLTK